MKQRASDTSYLASQANLCFGGSLSVSFPGCVSRGRGDLNPSYASLKQHAAQGNGKLP